MMHRGTETILNDFYSQLVDLVSLTFPIAVVIRPAKTVKLFLAKNKTTLKFYFSIA